MKTLIEISPFSGGLREFEPLKSIGWLEAKLYKSLLNTESGEHSGHHDFFSFMDSVVQILLDAQMKTYK